MQTAHLLLSLGGDHGNTVPKFNCTAAEIAVLRSIHGEDSVKEIEPFGDVKRSHFQERMRLLSIYGAAKTEDQKPIVEGMFPGVAARVFENLNELGLDESFFKATGRMSAPVAQIDPNAGPTIAEYVAAGYLAVNYPPQGYASKSTPEEIAAAIAAQPEPAAPAWNAEQPEAAAAAADEAAADEADEGVGEDMDDAHAESNVLG